MTTETPFDFDGYSAPSATSQMYLLITTGIWMNQSSTKTRRSTDDEEANAPFWSFWRHVAVSKRSSKSFFTILCKSNVFQRRKKLENVRLGENRNGRLLYR